jgi:hypothetical protein
MRTVLTTLPPQGRKSKDETSRGCVFSYATPVECAKAILRRIEDG